MDKTKRINGVDCSASCFAYVGDVEDTATWKFCIHVPDNDFRKTINALKTSMHHIVADEGLPDSEKQRVFDTVRGALLSHGIAVDRLTFAAKGEAPPAPVVQQPTATPVKRQTADMTDPTIAEAIARADHRATELLRSLGLE